MATPATVKLDGVEYPPIGRGEYDVIIFGVGFRECLLASLLIKANKNVLLISKKSSITWDNTGFDLNKLFQRFREEEPIDEDYEALGSNKDYHVDLIPKVLLSYGQMASLLKDIGVYDKLEWESVAHMVYSGRNKRVYRLPCSPEDANRSPLLTMMQKMRWKNFLQAVEEKEKHPDLPSSHAQPSTVSMDEVYEKYGISEGSRAFIGHGMAMYPNDDYLDDSPKPFFSRIQQYLTACASTTSPFLYLVSGKQQLCSVLRDHLAANAAHCDQLLQLSSSRLPLTRSTSKQLVFENAHVAGVVVGARAARAPAVVGDCTWFRSDRQKKVGKVIRSVCLLNHPIDGCEPGASLVVEVFRKQLVKAGFRPHESDIHALCLSWKTKVCPKGIYVVTLSTTVETQKPGKELEPVVEMLGGVLEQFDSVTTMYKSKKATRMQGIHIFRSPDASVSLESVAEDVITVFNQVVTK